MENEIYQELTSNLTEIKNAIEGLSPIFWMDYSFWISAISTLVLVITLVYLIKYTKATQEMKNEMVHQRIMNHAHDISFRITLYYISQNSKDNHFGKLKTNEHDTNIIDFVFTDSNNKSIGRSTKFHKITEADSILKSNYFIENNEDRTRFLTTLQEQGGRIEALVKTSIGEEFIYTYEAMQKNWKKVISGENTNLSDDFILIKKRHK